MRVKYTIGYRKGAKNKRVTGYLRVPKDLPDCFDSSEVIDFLCDKHNLSPADGLDIRLHNYTSKQFEYENSIKEGTAEVARQAARSRN